MTTRRTASDRALRQPIPRDATGQRSRTSPPVSSAPDDRGAHAIPAGTFARCLHGSPWPAKTGTIVKVRACTLERDATFGSRWMVRFAWPQGGALSSHVDTAWAGFFAAGSPATWRP